MNALTEAFQYAGMAKRLKAFSFDYLIIAAYVVFLLGIGLGIRAVIGPLEEFSPLFASPIARDALAFLTMILPVALYFTVQESSANRATWGKRKMGILVVNAAGEKLTRRQALVRSLVKLLPWQIAHTCIFHIEGWPLETTTLSPLVMAGFGLVYALVGIYIASALMTKKHRTPYDWAAGSYVIVGQ